MSESSGNLHSPPCCEFLCVRICRVFNLGVRPSITNVQTNFAHRFIRISLLFSSLSVSFCFAIPTFFVHSSLYFLHRLEILKHGRLELSGAAVGERSGALNGHRQSLADCPLHLQDPGTGGRGRRGLGRRAVRLHL